MNMQMSVAGAVLAQQGDNAFANMFDALANQLLIIAGAALAVAIIIVGFKVMFAIRNGDNIREAIQNMGVVAIAALIVFGASGIAGALQAIGSAAGEAAGN